MRLARTLTPFRTQARARCYSDDAGGGERAKSSGLAKAIIIGNVGQDPKLTRFDDGGAICQFSLATTNAYRTREGVYESKTDWFNVTCRQPQLVETIERVVKRGQTLYVEGPIEVRDYTDKDGVERRAWSVKLLNNGSFRIIKWPQNSGGMEGGYGNVNNSNGRNVFGVDRDHSGQVYE